MREHGLLTAFLLLLRAADAEALQEPHLCYVLDGILFVYGIILTFLYCRLKIQYRRKAKPVPAAIYEKVDTVYTGLGSREDDTYTSLDLPKVQMQEMKPKEEPQAE